MRLHGPLLTISALGIAVAAVSALAVWTSVDHARAVRALYLRTMITVDPGSHETFAPPPASAMPALTAAQAFAQWVQQAGGTHTTIPADTTVKLGLLTLPVGPYCGAECHGLIVHDGIAYTVRNQLAYGYGSPAFPHRRTGRMNWLFLDASTGQMIVAVLQRVGGRPSLGRHGTVTGVFLMVGGPSPGVSVRLPGRVIATSTAGRRFEVAASSSGRFTFHLPPGSYQLTGYSPRVHVNNAEMRCAAAHRVRVRVGQSARRNVYCSVR